MAARREFLHRKRDAKAEKALNSVSESEVHNVAGQLRLCCVDHGVTASYISQVTAVVQMQAA